MTLLTILLQQGGGGGLEMILLIVAMFAIMYFLMIRPQQKRVRRDKKFRDALTKGDKIVTAGGIYGTIRDTKENAFIVEIADGVRIRVDKRFRLSLSSRRSPEHRKPE